MIWTQIDTKPKRFWEDKLLSDMSTEEWESLCDGCARCCMIKLEDETTGEVSYTAAVCHLLDSDSCRCTKYSQRSLLVANCVNLTPDRTVEFHWLPRSCAYRAIAEGRELEAWHPLLSKDPESVHRADISVRDKVVTEDLIHEDELEDMIVQWVQR